MTFMKRNVTKCFFAITCLLLMFFFNVAFGQPASAGQSISFQKGRLYTTAGKKIEFYILIMDGNVCRYKVNGSDSIFKEISTDKILKIDVKKKDNALSIAGGGVLELAAGLWLIDGDNVTVSGPPVPKRLSLG